MVISLIRIINYVTYFIIWTFIFPNIKSSLLFKPKFLNKEFCMKKVVTVALGSLLFSSVSFAVPANETLDPIEKFVTENLLKKTVSSEKSGTIEGTDLRYTWKASTSASNLRRSDESLSFDFTFNVEQTNYTRNPDGTEKPNNVSRIGVQTCEFRTSKSENAPKGILIGVCRATSNTAFNFLGTTNIVNARLEGTKLVLRTTYTTAGDCFANTSTEYKLCTSTSVDEYELVNGKLQVKKTGTTSWVTDFDKWTLEPKGGPEVNVYTEK